MKNDLQVFSPSLWCVMSFDAKEFLILIKLYFLIFIFMDHDFGVI